MAMVVFKPWMKGIIKLGTYGKFQMFLNVSVWTFFEIDLGIDSLFCCAMVINLKNSKDESS